MTRYAHPVNPATYDSSDGFGSMLKRRTPHKGIDYMVPTGTVATSPCGGTIINAQWSNELGNVVGVAFDDGMFGGLAHNSDFLVNVGQRVELGTPLSATGNTGSASQGPHLHFSLGSTPGAVFGEGYGSTLVDPFAYIQNHLTAAAGGNSSPVRTGSNAVTLYHRQGTTPTLYALAGDSPGTPANWLETTAQSLANGWSDQIGGPSTGLNDETWALYKKSYLASLSSTGGAPGVPADNTAVLKSLAELTAAVVAKPNPPTATAIAEAIILEQKKPGN